VDNEELLNVIRISLPQQGRIARPAYVVSFAGLSIGNEPGESTRHRCKTPSVSAWSCQWVRFAQVKLILELAQGFIV